MIEIDHELMSRRQLGPEVRKTVRARLESGFFECYLGGANVLDIGYRGNSPDNQPIVPHAIGVDLGYPGYDGKTLPFEDMTQDAVHSSHCLEHIPDPIAALAEWFRVLRHGGYLVLTVPHQQLYERKPTPTSRWGGNEHLRFYSPASLLTELETALPLGEFRIRSLQDNDAGFDYGLAPEQPPIHCCYEIEVVVQRIAPPAHASALRLSPAAKAAIEAYRVMIDAVLRLDAIGAPMDEKALRLFGEALEIPPYAVVSALYPDTPHTALRRLLAPLVDPSVVDARWYVDKYPDVSVLVRDDPNIAFEHYRHSGYFERKLPNMRVGLYG
jgi:SAM-dependent methyltransferase